MLTKLKFLMIKYFITKSSFSCSVSLSGRFRYYYKRNSHKHITVICKMTYCLWNITCHAIGASDVVQVHTFQNEHSHTVDDVVASQPVVGSNCAVVVIDEVIQSTPEYQPRKICKILSENMA